MKTEECKAGDLDLTFGKKGFTLIDGVDYFFAITTDEHDNIYAAGRTLDNKFYVARLTPDGQLDPGFNGVGYVTGTFGDFNKSQALTVSIDDKNRVLITGNSYGFENGAGLARFMPDGKLDETFGVNGKIIIPRNRASERHPTEPAQPYSASSQSCACTVLDDGKILLFLRVYGGSNPYIIRLEENGEIDKTFNGKGFVHLAYAGKDIYPSCLRVINGERILVAAAVKLDFEPIDNGLLVACDFEGRPDRSFGDGGYALLSKPTKEQGGLHISDLHQLPDQQLWAIGRTGPSPMGFPVPENGVLTRLGKDGFQDKAFNNGDPVLTDFTGEWISGAVQDDGKVVVAGTRWDEGVGALARYHSDGRPDTIFGDNGIRYFPSWGTGRLVTLQKDGRIIAGGRMSPDGGPVTSVLLRYHK